MASEPKASRPHMPGYGISSSTGGDGLLPWQWARDRLTKAHNYWMTSTRSDGAPHCMPVWGIWMDDVFYFSTGRRSRKSRNLESSPRCVVCTERADEAVIVEGSANKVEDAALLRKFADSYNAKYEWGDVAALGDPVYGVHPHVAFGWSEKSMTNTATRWKFGTNS